MGLPWVPYGVGVITIGLVVGLLMAYTVESLFPRTRTSSDRQDRLPVLEKLAPPQQTEVRRHRLAEEKARLDQLAAERERRRESAFGKATEERIVWAELLDLELQDIDEQFTHLDKGGIHDRNDS